MTTARTKKIVSTFAVAVAVAVVGTLGHYVVKLPAEVQTGAMSILGAALYAIRSWGTQDEIDDKVADQVTKAINGEPK